MKNIYFTVGPSQLFPSIEKHIQNALKENILSMSHRGKEFHSMFESTISLLKKLLDIPKDYSVYFLSSGTEGMERVIENTVEEKSFHIITGSFGKRFLKTSEEFGKQVEKLEALNGVDLENISVPKKAEVICITQNDTSTGVALSEKNIAALKKKNPKTLIAIDLVSSAPYANIDYKNADCVLFSVQKGFGLPAGLGVLVVSPEAQEKSTYLLSNGVSIGSYHNFPTLADYAQKSETPETPNVLGIYLFEKILSEMNKTGIKKIRSETKRKAKILYDFFETSKKYSPAIEDEIYRSQTTLVINVKNGSAELLKKAKEKGIVIGSGYGVQKEKQMRIGNFPAHSDEDIQKLLQVLK